MTNTIRTTRTAMLAATLTAALCGLSHLSIAAAQAAGTAEQAPVNSPASSPASSDAAARLNKKQFRDVKVTVDNGIATLTGTVDLYVYKADAAKHVSKANGVTSVRNLIDVAGPTVPDQQLQAKLQEKLAYDRVFYGNAFNAISLGVQNGVVTLGGHALSYNSRNSALGLVTTYPGVKDVVDEMQVDPVSMMDNRIRVAVYRAVYGYPMFTKYAIDPAKPIRISVQNGNVELYGAVDSQADNDVATIRANGVAGVFSVKNFLQVGN
ncbi:MAG: BON domain-containing protein [Terracidiphilus sp.]